MSEIITAIYESKATVLNAYDDLVSSGIPQEKIKIDEDKHQVQVMSPETSEPEIREILQRHQPLEVHV